MKPILEINKLSKKYLIKSENKPYLSLRDQLFQFNFSNSSVKEFYALKDVSFKVMAGESIGIIGKNGAGKSTLLKILSKITPPTSGSIICRGRVASLLEVGTGFHPELTGRENVFFNGSILGMNKNEIKKNFESIVEFSGINQFIDTPLKNYSSGMQLRLAFAVAAFLDNEILVIDEILSVGDYEFQKKCLGKMNEISKSGRTVLFVSHDLNALSVLTKNAILLKEGQLAYSGETNQVIAEYFFQKRNELDYINKTSPEDKPIIKKVKVNTSHPNNVHAIFQDFYVQILLEFPKNFKQKSIWISIQICDGKGKNIVHVWHNLKDLPLISENNNTIHFKCSILSFKLYKGQYTLNVYLAGSPAEGPYDAALNICHFEVIMLNMYREYPFEADACTYLENSTWSIENNPF